MNTQDLLFLEEYEKRLMAYNLLFAIKEKLTEKGKETSLDLRRWLDLNLDKYLNLQR